MKASLGRSVAFRLILTGAATDRLDAERRDSRSPAERGNEGRSLLSFSASSAYSAVKWIDCFTNGLTVLFRLGSHRYLSCSASISTGVVAGVTSCSQWSAVFGVLRLRVGLVDCYPIVNQAVCGSQ